MVKLKKRGGAKAVLAAVLALIITLALGIGIHLAQLNEIKNNLKVEGLRFKNIDVTGDVAGIPTGIKLNLELLVQNPTSYTLDIERLTYNIYVEDRLLGEGTLQHLVIPAHSTHPIPVTLEISAADAISLLIDYIRSGGLRIKISGMIDVPIKLFGVMKFFTVSAPYTVERQLTVSGIYIPTSLTLDTPPSIVEEGDVIIFTGRLIRADTGEPIANALIKIYDSDVEFDDLMAQGYTDSNGYFSIRWVAKKMDPFDNTVEVYAKFEGSGLCGSSLSSRYTITVLSEIPTRLTLNPPPNVVEEGEVVVFTGRLVRADTGEPIPNALIKIYDSDIDFEDLMAQGYTDSEGYFSIRWIAKKMDPLDNTVEVYAKFEGGGKYQTSKTDVYTITVLSEIPTRLILDQPPSVVEEGEVVIFTGRLIRADTGEPIANALIKIYDSDIDFDDLLAQGYTDSNGYFSIRWVAERGRDPDDTLEVYAKFEGSGRYKASKSDEYRITVQAPTKIPTRLTLDQPPSSVEEGDVVIFTGRLVRADTGEPIPNALIKIYDSDVEFDDLVAQGYTDSEGYFSIRWIAKKMDPLDNTVEIYAKFEGSDRYQASKTDVYTITVLSAPTEIKTMLILDQPPSNVKEGDVIVFTGRLIRADTGEPVPNALIKIYDSDIDFDDLLAQGYTDSNGYFSIRWVAKKMDPFDNTVEVYAKFEGSGRYQASQSTKYTITVEP